VGSQLYSSNLGFYYTLTSISRWDDATQGETSLPSVVYLNSTLDDCRTDNVNIKLRKYDSSSPPNAWWITYTWSSSVTTAICTVASENGPTNITLEVTYSGNGDTVYDYFINDNQTTRTSAWWGTRILNAYWNGVLSASSQEQAPPNTSWVGGALNYGWNNSQTKGCGRQLSLQGILFH
jgi:hypothetical protein